MKQKLTDLYAKNGTKKVLASLLSILAGLLLGSIVVIIVGLAEQKITTAGMWEGVRLIFAGILSTGRDAAGALTWGFNAQNVGNMLFRAMPLIMTGLSVAVAFKTGLFNIGAPGQYLMGTLVSLSVALGIPSESVPVGIIWLLAFLGGMLAGALWGAIPGLLKALLNINEVLACIMTNWIAANLVTWMFDISSFKNVTEGTKSGYIYKTTFNGVATPKLGLDQLFPGSQVNAGILVAIILAIVGYMIMEKTVFGYELKACGANRHAARYAGIPDKRNIVLSMAIAGALVFMAANGQTMNIFSQIGIIMLIGLVAKNGILIVEFANQKQDAGLNKREAIEQASLQRLRPILMTVLTCVFGMIPLVLSHGVGANGNSTLGAGVIGGMIVGTLALLFLVPTLFIVFQTLQEKVKPLEFDPDPQWAVRAELEECKNEKE